MGTIEITLELPYFLRSEDAVTARYEAICHENQAPELVGQDVEINFTRRSVVAIDKSDWPEKERTTVIVKLTTHSTLTQELASSFAIRNVPEIVHRIVNAYRVATGEVSNTGFIVPVGTSDIQLFADIRLDGKDIRDRWPSHSLNTFPLSEDEKREFESYLTGTENIPLDKLLLTNAALTLGQGQYSLAVLQAATAVEVCLTRVIVYELRSAGWSQKAIDRYEKKTLGSKLEIPDTDPRSAETHFGNIPEFPSVLKSLRTDVNPLRNNVIHRGRIASHDEAICTVNTARQFREIVQVSHPLSFL